jgi:hypothetical protein
MLPRRVTADNYRQLGFDSVDEARQARLGRPMPVAFISLNALKGYTREKDPRTLLTRTSELYYPVTVGDATKTAITLAKNAKGYQFTSVGHAEVIRHLTAYRTGAESDDFIVRVPVQQPALPGATRGLANACERGCRPARPDG